MKRILKGAEPQTLAVYRQQNPNGTWEQCKNNKNRKNEIHGRIKADQGNLCAYCEIDLRNGATVNSDIRVEHFHPKSDQSTGYNWHIDWGNLLGCCHGGSQRHVVDAADRFTTDHSCDVSKGSDILDDLILNPLNIPPTPALFRFARANGEISVNKAACQSANVPLAKAQATIDYLRLDANRLRRLRKAVLNRLNHQLTNRIANGQIAAQARQEITQAILRKDNNGHWPAFFSSIRSYFGQAAEAQLADIDYQG